MTAESGFEHALSSKPAPDLVRAELSVEAWWLPESPRQPLLAVAAADDCGRWHWTLCPDPAAASRWLDDRPTAGFAALTGLARAFDLPLLGLGAPLTLQAARVDKPWGRELWYSGIEARGVTRVGAPGPGLPLPWVLAALPGRFAGTRQPPLLKVLDPHSDPLLGDLYFELHERKEEAYLVTRIDPDAWPDGATLRLGLRQELIEALTEAGVRREFAAAVDRYQVVRRRIDALIDRRKCAAGLDANAVIAPELHRHWLQEVPAALQAEEQALRAAVAGFIDEVPIDVGDLLHIPPRVPHGLRHGIRVVELQTPTYERRLLFFGQKPLTQDTFDPAGEDMCLRPPTPAGPVRSGERSGVVEASSLCIDGARLTRMAFSRAGSKPLPQAAYGILMGLEGRVHCAGAALGREDAVLLPGDLLAGEGAITAEAGAACVLVLPEQQP